MSKEVKQTNIIEILADHLGATHEITTRSIFSIYVPNKDRLGNLIQNYNEWLLKVKETLTTVLGGTTTISTNGTWQGDEIVYEDTCIVESYVMNEKSLFDNLTKIRDLLHDFGRETNQGAVAFRYNGVFFEIEKYDLKKST